VGEEEQSIGGIGDILQRGGLLQCRRQRLVTDNVNAGLEESGGDRRVEVIGNYNRNRVDPVFAAGTVRAISA